MTFSIFVDLSSDRFHQEVAKGGNLLVKMHIRYDQSAFPSEDWFDFPVIVLGWWLEDLGRLRRARKPVISTFMDGPYEFAMTKHDESIELLFRRRTKTGHEEVGSAEVPWEEYRDALLDAGASLVAALEPLGVRSNDLDFLKSRLAAVERGPR